MQQIWKRIGGASSPTEILFIGDNELDINLTKVFKAPKVKSVSLSQELIPLEIKVFLDTIESKL